MIAKIHNGFTFIEMIMAITIMSLTVTGFALLFTRIWVAQGFILETGIASLIASRGVNNAVAFIREGRESATGSFPIVRAKNGEFDFYVDYDDDGVIERLRYFVDTEKFRVGVVEPTISSASISYAKTGDCLAASATQEGEEFCNDVSDFVVNNASLEPVFEYYDEFNTALVPDGTTGEVLVSDITMVRVLLFVNPDPDQAPNNVKVQSYALMRNLSNFGDVPT